MSVKDLLLVIIQIVLFILFAVTGKGSGSDFTVSIFAFLITVTGTIICVAGLLKLGSNLTPLPTPKSSGELVIGGVYKYIRHPIYSGIIIAAFGISLYSYSIPRFIITAVLYFFFRYKSQYEESMLIEKYKGYRDYMQNTGRFFPLLKR